MINALIGLLFYLAFAVYKILQRLNEIEERLDNLE